MEKPLQVFCCYAREDQQSLLTLKKHLRPIEREGLIIVQAAIDVSPGEKWEQKISNYLNAAQIILLLISPDFMNSEYCYSKEMTRAMERHEAGEACVIPIILRPTLWKEAPFGKLQVLPEDAKPITTWHNKDNAFHNVSQKLRDEVLSLTEEEEHRLSEEGLVYVPNTLWHRFNKAFFKGANTGRLRKGGLLVVITILLAAVLSFSTHLISFPVCLATSCPLSQPPASQSAPRNAARVSDGRLSVMNLRVDSSSYWFSGDPWSYSGGGKLPTAVGAVLLASKTTSSYTIVLEVQNVQHTGNSILIDDVTLQSLQIFSIPQHLTVWTPGIATTDTTHPYPTTYTGQPGQSLYAIPSQNVSLADDETDQLDIQVHSTVSVYLQFKLAITYHIAGVAQTLALPWTFQVIFSDASNWNEYILQGGSLVRKP